jgi:hypothetical protein
MHYIRVRRTFDLKTQLFVPVLLLFSMVCGSQPSVIKSINASQWQEDVRYFGEQLVKKHKNAFHNVSKEDFEKDLEQLYNDAPGLKDYQVIVRLMQITAKVGDGHTGVHLPVSFSQYPVRFNWFGDKLYLIAAAPNYKDILGTEVIKIGDHSMNEIKAKLATVVSQIENKWYEMTNQASFLLFPEILVTIGLVPDLHRANFTFLDSNNREITRELIPVNADANRELVSASKSAPMFRQNLNNPFYYTYLPDINAVYVNFKKYDELRENANKLFAFIDEKKASRLIVDLRFNGGGDYKKGQRLLIDPIKNHPLLSQKGNLFVVTGRRTFSAAMVNSIDFKKETNAIILGEPPGEKPNSYSENDEMKLPNSGLIISYSTRYYKFLDEDVPAFEPDIRIDPSWNDFRDGRDAVMEWITAFCKKKS